MGNELTKLQYGKKATSTAQPAGTGRAARHAVAQSQNQSVVPPLAPAIGTSSLGETANTVGGMKLAQGAAEAISNIVQRGLLGGLSDRSISKLTSRAMTAFGEGTQSGIRISRNSFSATPAGTSGLRDENGNMRINTGRLPSMSEVAKSRGWDRQPGTPWSAASDKGLGAGGGYNYQTDRGLGFVPPVQTDAGPAAGEQSQFQLTRPSDTFDLAKPGGLRSAAEQVTLLDSIGAGSGLLRQSMQSGLGALFARSEDSQMVDDARDKMSLAPFYGVPSNG